MLTTPKQILKKYWGYDGFRAKQLEAINTVLDKKNALVLMPTGGGKSLCYQVPAMAMAGICVVVSPLLALMEDQVLNLSKKNIKALFIPSGTSFKNLEILLNNCEYGNYKFLYLSPERLQNEYIRQRLLRMNINLLAVDEAHCISEWGHDFRPAYQNIKIFSSQLQNIPIVALTATATHKVQNDIVKSLQFENFEVFKNSYLRENLSYGVYKTQDKDYLLLQILKKQQGSAIVYVATRKLTEQIADFLKDQQIAALPFHGGLQTEIKQSNFEKWRNDEVKVMVATNAFGMGIDKPNVRVVVHMHIPNSLENYFQEAGRAGRDGNRAYALLLKTPTSVESLKNKFEKQTPTIDFVKLVYRKLSSYFQIGYGEGKNEIKTFAFTHFCNRYQLSKSKVYATLKILDKNGILNFQEKSTQTTTIKLLVDIEKLYRSINNNTKLVNLIDYLGRRYEGIALESVKINLGEVSQALETSQNEVTKRIEKLHQQELLVFENNNHDCVIEYLQPREDDLAINAIKKYIKSHLKNRVEKLKSVVNFVENDKICKTKQLLAYFDEKIEDCGICSVCTKKTKQITSTEVNLKMEKFIVHKLGVQPLSSREIFEDFTFSEEDLIATLQRLLEKEIIKITPSNRYQLVNKI